MKFLIDSQFINDYQQKKKIPIIIDDIKPKYEQLMSEINKADNSNNLILWKGLKQLYCTKRLQNIEHFPSDLVWQNKTKNVYLLEIDRAINQKKWREWLNICYGVIIPIKDDEYSSSKQKKIIKGGPIPPNPLTMIQPDSIKKLIPFLIKQTLTDKYLQDNILEKLTPEHSQKILKQFMDRIERSDIKYIAYQRNKFIAKHGNNPLKRLIRYDEEFTNTINNKLSELDKIDKDLADKFRKCWSETDESFMRFTSPKTNRKNNDNLENEYDLEQITKHIESKGMDTHSDQELKILLDDDQDIEHEMDEFSMNEQDILYWDQDKEFLLSLDKLKEKQSNDDNNDDNEQQHDSQKNMNAKDKLIYSALQYFIEKVPSQYRAHHNLLRHTIDDCSKLAMLDPDLLKEGYSGDNGHFKWGLWQANNLPIFTLRPHLLALRDIICNKNMLGAYIEINGKYGTGKSLALMYAVNIARKITKGGKWICIYCPDTHEWIQKIKLTVPANDKDSVFYQHDYAREFFEKIKLSESDKLKNIPLSNEYKVKYKGNEKEGEDTENTDSNKIDLETVYAMLEDPVDIKRYEHDIIKEWMKMGSSYIDQDGKFEMSNNKNKFETLYDMVEYGISNDCKYPASLMYDFIDEIKKQKEYKVLIACDNIDWWSNFVYGLSTPRNPKVFAWQLSMIDIFSQFQQINSLNNGMVIMSRTTMGRNRVNQFKTKPSHIIQCPEHYTNDEFDSIMWNYQGIKLCSPNIAPDDYKKIYAASAKRPIYAQRIAALY